VDRNRAQCGLPDFTKGLASLRPIWVPYKGGNERFGGIGVGILMTTPKGALGAKGPVIVCKCSVHDRKASILLLLVQTVEHSRTVDDAFCHAQNIYKTMTGPFAPKAPFGVVIRIPTPMPPKPLISTLIRNPNGLRLASPFVKSGRPHCAPVSDPQVIEPALAWPHKQIDPNGPSYASGKTINLFLSQTKPYVSSLMWRILQ